jgi:hypothetical protein
MGWVVYITRAVRSYQTQQHPIAESKWLSVIAEDSTLQPSADDYYERQERDGSVKRYHPVLWIEHPKKPRLFFMDGAIHCTSPDERMMIKMVHIAKKLGAKVLDEDDRTYTLSESGQMIVNEPTLD